MRVLIAIPARYESTRFPGKPLAKIHGKEMLLRVWEIAQKAASKFEKGVVACAVGTEDQRIVDFCKRHNITCYMTSRNCLTGTDRVKEVMDKVAGRPEFVVNLQGDNPLCPPWFVESVIEAYLKDTFVQVVTPVVNLSWVDLDRFRENKKTTPFSGTCAIIHPVTSDAIWFSKSIVPAIRKEAEYRLQSLASPIFRHIGLYGYTPNALEKFAELPETAYEKLEGLEQLRFLENGMTVRTVTVDYGKYKGMSGVDSPEDVIRAEDLLSKQGEMV
jgi:3-deoxy-manno-octulosonate cytidylyltransferase (CMP-KDO synthetase)